MAAKEYTKNQTKKRAVTNIYVIHKLRDYLQFPNIPPKKEFSIVIVLIAKIIILNLGPTLEYS